MTTYIFPELSSDRGAITLLYSVFYLEVLIHATCPWVQQQPCATPNLIFSIHATAERKMVHNCPASGFFSVFTCFILSLSAPNFLRSFILPGRSYTSLAARPSWPSDCIFLVLICINLQKPTNIGLPICLHYYH